MFYLTALNRGIVGSSGCVPAVMWPLKISLGWNSEIFYFSDLGWDSSSVTTHLQSSHWLGAVIYTSRSGFSAFHCYRLQTCSLADHLAGVHNLSTENKHSAADLLLLLCIWWLSKPPKVSARRGKHTGPTPPPSWTLAIAPPRLLFTSACNVSTVTHTHTHRGKHQCAGQ